VGFVAEGPKEWAVGGVDVGAKEGKVGPRGEVENDGQPRR
jgi:hypothetical protein